MALPRQRKYIGFNDGASESSDPDVNPGMVSSLINGGYDHDDAISRRTPFSRVGSATANLGLHLTGLVGANGEAVIAQGAVLPVLNASSYAAGGIDAVTKSRLRPCYPLDYELVSSAPCLNVYGTATVAGAGVACMVTDLADGAGNHTMYIAVIDLATHALVYSVQSTVGYTAAYPVYYAGKFYVYAMHGSAIDVITVDFAADSSATATLTSVYSGDDAYFIARPVDDSGTLGAVLAYNEVTTRKLKVTLVTGAVISASFADASITLAKQRDVCVDPGTGKYYVAYFDSGATKERLVVLKADLSAEDHSPVDLGSVDMGSSNDPILIAYQPNSTAPSRFYVAYNGSRGGSTGRSFVQHIASDFSAGVVATYDRHNIRALWCMPMGKDGADSAPGYQPFALFINVNNATAGGLPHAFVGRVTVPVGADYKFGNGSGRQFFTTTGFAFPVSMAATASSGHDHAPTVATDGAGTYYVLMRRLVQAASTTVPSAASYRADLVAFHIANGRPAPSHVTAEGVDTVAAGLPSVWDGRDYTESCPLQPPTVVLTTHAGGGSLTGTFGYYAVASWVDANGTLYRSAPSALLSVVAASWSSITVTATMPLVGTWSYDPSLTGAQFVRPMLIQFYRTVAGGATPYLVSSSVVQGGESIAFVDAYADGNITGNAILYTNGGVLESQAPPAMSAVTYHRGRMFGISAEDPGVIWFTKVKEDATAFEWNGELTLRIPGTPRTIASMDDKLLVLADSETWVVTGEGPDATGAGSFAPPERVAMIGASGRNSIVVTPFGAFIHAPSGMKMLGRDLQVQDVGTTLDTLPGTVVIQSSAHYAGRQEAWFAIQGTPKAVAFNYERGRFRWSLMRADYATAFIALHESSAMPRLLVATASAYEVDVADPSATHDASGFTTMAVTTGWFRPVGPGVTDCRFRKLSIYGRFPTSNHCKLQVDIELQGEQRSVGTKETFTFTAAELARIDPGLVRLTLKRQRGFAARVTLTTIVDDTNSGQWNAQGIAWEYGINDADTVVGATSMP